MGLIVSGGHTSLYRCGGPLDFELLGGTIDDAAGEAFDKVAAMLGLPYPGGPAIEAAARGGNPRGVCLAAALLARPDRLDFSFSGLKTAVRYAICPPGTSLAGRADCRRAKSPTWRPVFKRRWSIASSAKAMLALEQTGSPRCASAAAWRPTAASRATDGEMPRRGVELHIPPPHFAPTTP